MHSGAPIIMVQLSGSDLPEIVATAPSTNGTTKDDANQIHFCSSTSRYESEGLKIIVLGRLWNRDAFASIVPESYGDAELLARAYHIEGAKTFSRSEGASIFLLDRMRRLVYLFRDWPGLNTFYYAHSGRTFVATNLKKLVAFPDLKIRELSAGWCLKIALTNLKPELKQYLTLKPRKSTVTFREATKRVRDLVGQAVERRRVAGQNALLLSGGVDSTILAYLMKSCKIEFQAYTLSLKKPLFPVKTAEFDLYAARRVACHLQIPLSEVLLEEDELVQGIENAIRCSETSRTTLVDEMCGYQFMAKKLARVKPAAIYSGEGADTIFGGFWFALRFVHHEDLPAFARQSAQTQLPAGLATAQKVFHALAGVDMVFPYCSISLASYALSLPIEYRIDKARFMKTVLRAAFANEIPEEFLLREKGITRETTHIRYVLEKRFGVSRYRYLAAYKKLFCN